MRSSNRLRPLSAAALGAALCVGCYDSTSLRLEVRSPSTHLDCVATADRVFADAGFERVRTMSGADMFYTPRTTASSFVALHWGIGAWLNRDNPNGTCDVSLEALSRDPGVSQQAMYTSQRGEYYDSTVRDMAKRLEVAFGGTP
jgi:hypothetical protein